MIALIIAVVWMFPSIFAILTKSQHTIDVVIFNFAIGWLPPVWWFLVWAVWDEWPWWHGVE